MPGQGECNYKRNVDLPILLVLDQIRDPGNMGTIIRSAAAIGCQRILVSKGCVDIWDPKVIRSGMGAHFRLPIITKLTYEDIDTYLPLNTTILYADCEKQATTTKDTNNNKLKQIDYSRFVQSNTGLPHITLFIGNESFGINQKFQTITKIKKENQAFVNIPLGNGVESLNASIAFSIIGYELKKLFNK
jgi:tRNA G18 (ribose-2'-O)-methylase SpoU